MRILFDHQVFSWQVYGGVSRYFYELVSGLKKEGVECELALSYSNNFYIRNGDISSHKPFLESKNFWGRGFVMKHMNTGVSKKALKKGDFDIFHPTYYDPYFLKYLKGKPFVVTVYDMIHEIYPDDFLWHDFTAKHKKIVVAKAAKVIAISENTKKDLVRLYDIDPSKIEVVHLGRNLASGEGKAPKNPLPSRYILFVGSRKSYKNFVPFITSIAPLLQSDSDLQVVCTGGGAFIAEEQKLFEELGISGRIQQISASDDELIYIYKHALVFVFPSLYEGFGFPTLEAFDCQCPVVCSNTSSFPEVAGDAAEFCDPTNTESIRQAVETVISNEVKRSEMIAKGNEQAKKFSWQETAKKTKAVYESLL